MVLQDKGRVLVVDDDRDICANIKDILDDLGYLTDTAHDGPSALNLIQQGAYDVALLDFKMPGMNGVELYREIKKLRPDVPAIMITAHAESAGLQQAIDAGTRHILRKPVDFACLLPMIDRCATPGI
ncbi:response regulator [Stieleria varia]|uniref:Response regulator receiver protein n=1 Tax=Stieleria varia TaxID=2528005 RepID=A0A5C6ASP9_9BACT|nr:response regulator [Stieleria varia]TWU02457.1 Response regulator receiver protein [Stieleria varia]